MGNVRDFYGLVQLLLGLLKSVVPLLLALALVVFLFGVMKYVTAGSGEDKTKARDLMIYGIIALFVMVSVWGLVGILVTTVFGGPFSIPQLR